MGAGDRGRAIAHVIPGISSYSLKLIKVIDQQENKVVYGDEQSQLPSSSLPDISPSGISEKNTHQSAGLENDGDRKTARFLILAILFFVTGFLGLPVLWLSKSFSLTEKIVWSILNIIYTCALIAGTVAICVWALRPFFSAIP